MPNIAPFLALTPQQFEERVAELLASQGYRDVRVVGGSGDLAADIVCRTPDRKRQVVVQCKRYQPNRKVGSREVQTFIGMATVHHRVDKGMFVTSSSFTEQARKLAVQHGIQLVDGSELAHWAEKYGQTQNSLHWLKEMFKEAFKAAKSADEAPRGETGRPASWAARHKSILRRFEESANRNRNG